MQSSLRLSLQLDLLFICHVETRPVQPNVGAQIPSQQWMLMGRIASDEEYCGRTGDVAKACGLAFVSGQRSCKCDVIGRAIVIDVVRLEDRTRKLLQQVILFVGGVV